MKVRKPRKEWFLPEEIEILDKVSNIKFSRWRFGSLDRSVHLISSYKTRREHIWKIDLLCIPTVQIFAYEIRVLNVGKVMV